MVEIISQEALAEQLDAQGFADGIDLKQYLRMTEWGDKHIVEIRSSDFATAWYERQRYEVDAGRLEVPTLFEPIYNVISDPTLPKNVSINVLGPGGVVFEEVTEGGEVKFANLGESEYSVRIRHYGVGLEYSKDLVIFNEQWNLGLIERAAGKAYNALLNHIHLNPIITATLTGDNATAASSDGDNLIEKTVRTMEDAITDAQTDDTNPRMGPYVLLANPANRFQLERAFTAVPQVGTPVQSSVVGMVNQMIFYRGWTGTRGHKVTSYSGVPAGTVFLIDIANKVSDFQSYFKQDLQSAQGNEDVSRFILEQVVYDAYFGVYANPTRAVQKITLPA